MSTQSFYGFTALPYTLRHQIWQMAIRPTGPGVHYFSILNLAKDNHGHRHSPSAEFAIWGDGPLAGAAPRVAGRQPEYSWTQGNPSSYLWDTGLWTACKESREIITAHFNMQHWNEVRREYQRCHSWRFYPEGEKHQDKPGTAIVHHNGEELHLIVKPHRDLFFLDASEVEYTVDWDKFFFVELPFSRWDQGYGPLGHIAVEFDPSWSVGLPCFSDPHWDPNTSPGVDFNDLLEEKTPRGFIARAALECAEKAYYMNDHPFFWLIDRGIRCKTPSQRSPNFQPREFYDCNHKYIETKLENVAFDTLEEYYQTADCFLKRLGEMADAKLGLGIHRYFGWHYDEARVFWFEVEQCIGILACS